MRHERPVGLRFSQVYLKSEDLLSDSERFRKRLSMAVHELSINGREYSGLGRYLEGKLGVDGPVFSSTPPYAWKAFYLKIEIKDVLDSIVCVDSYFEGKLRELGGSFAQQGKARDLKDAVKSFRTSVYEIFSEEPIGYELDEKLGVHFRVDPAFSVAKQSAIAGLSSEKFKPAKEYIEQIDAYLTQDPMNGTQAIRSVFWAVENVGNQLLETREFDGSTIKKLNQYIADSFQGEPDGHLKGANAAIVQSFGKWISSCHNYRHEKGSPEPHQPPKDLAILLVNQGLGFVRWLAALDKVNKD